MHLESKEKHEESYMTSVSGRLRRQEKAKGKSLGMGYKVKWRGISFTLVGTGESTFDVYSKERCGQQDNTECLQGSEEDSSGIAKVCFSRCPRTMNRASLRQRLTFPEEAIGLGLTSMTCGVRNLGSAHPVWSLLVTELVGPAK